MKFLEKKGINKLKFIFKNKPKSNIKLNFYNKFYYTILSPFLIFTFFLKTKVNFQNYYEYIILSNSNIYIFSILSLTSLLLIYIFSSFKDLNQNQFLSFISVLSLIIFPYLFIIKSFFSIYLILEFLNLLIFLLIITNIFFIKKDRTTKVNKNLNYSANNYSHYYYSLFLYFWLTFLFSFSYILFIVLLNDNFINTNFFLIKNDFLLNKSIFSNYIVSFVFFLIITTKLTLPPLFILKIEIYKNLRISLVLLYSLKLFLFYVLFFTILLEEFLIVVNFIKPILIMYLVLTALILLLNLYKETNLRVFLSYSSIININLIILFILFKS